MIYYITNQQKGIWNNPAAWKKKKDKIPSARKILNLWVDGQQTSFLETHMKGSLSGQIQVLQNKNKSIFQKSKSSFMAQ